MQHEMKTAGHSLVGAGDYSLPSYQQQEPHPVGCRLTVEERERFLGGTKTGQGQTLLEMHVGG